MKRVTFLIAALTAAVLLGSAQEQTDKTVTGWVLDSACAFTKGLAKPISRECALACAKKGSQLVIFARRRADLLAYSGFHACRRAE